jgi:hypothetical protein
VNNIKSGEEGRRGRGVQRKPIVSETPDIGLIIGKEF